MNVRTILLLAGGLAVVIGIVDVVGRRISGGQKAFQRVAEVLKTNTFVIARVASPVGAIVQGNGPCHVALGADGRRHGFYSITIEGPAGKESLKAYWEEPMTASPNVYAIYRTKAWARDELVWGAARNETE